MVIWDILRKVVPAVEISNSQYDSSGTTFLGMSKIIVFGDTSTSRARHGRASGMATGAVMECNKPRLMILTSLFVKIGVSFRCVSGSSEAWYTQMPGEHGLGYFF